MTKGSVLKSASALAIVTLAMLLAGCADNNDDKTKPLPPPAGATVQPVDPQQAAADARAARRANGTTSPRPGADSAEGGR